MIKGIFPASFLNDGRPYDLAQALHERLRPAVSLWPEGHDILHFETKPSSKILKLPTIKGWTIVDSNCVRDPMYQKHLLHCTGDVGSISALVGKEDFYLWPL